jgi:hypothetical protein
VSSNIAVEMLPHLQAEAEARMKATLKRGGRSPAALKPTQRGRSTALAGKQVGVGRELAK